MSRVGLSDTPPASQELEVVMKLDLGLAKNLERQRQEVETLKSVEIISSGSTEWVKENRRVFVSADVCNVMFSKNPMIRIK